MGKASLLDLRNKWRISSKHSQQDSLMMGPPGSGKTLLAHDLPGILLKMPIDEALDVTRIYSVAD